MNYHEHDDGSSGFFCLACTCCFDPLNERIDSNQFCSSCQEQADILGVQVGQLINLNDENRSMFEVFGVDDPIEQASAS